MNLTRFERLMLANQLQILEAVNPDEAESYAYQREALEEGYELHYDAAFEAISSDTMTEADCHFVVDVLAMHRSLQFACNDLGDMTGIDAHDIEFRGFDGNEESRLLGYCKYFCHEKPGPGRFTELTKAWRDDFNSHWPMADRYRQMLKAWRESANPHELTKDDIVRIVAATR
jgi:uncharacterized protein